MEGRVRLREPLPEAGPASIAGKDEAGNPCFVEVVEDGIALEVALRALSTRAHPVLPVILHHEKLGGRSLVVENPGPGRPLSEALAAHSFNWSVARAARVLSLLCEGLEVLHRDTGGRLPVHLNPADLWLTPNGGLRLRTLGFVNWSPEAGDRGHRMAGAMRDLVRVLRLLSPEGAKGEFLWLISRCESGDACRCYRTFKELGVAFGRPVTDRTTRIEPAAPRPVPPPPPPPRPTWIGRTLATLLVLAMMVATGVWWTRPGPRPLTEPAMAIGLGRAVDLRSLWTGELLARMPLEESAGGLAATPEGRYLFASQPRGGRLAVVDLHRGRTLGQLAVDPDAQDLAMDEHGRWLFVSHPARALVTVVDLNPRRLVPGLLPARSASILAVEPGRVELAHGHAREGSQDLPMLYTSSEDTGFVSALRLKPAALEARVFLPGAGALAVSAGGRRLYVADRTEPKVIGLDARTLETVSTWPLQRAAVSLVRAGSRLWAVDAEGGLEPVDGPGPGFRLPLRGWKALVSGPRTDLLWALGGDPSCLLTIDPSRGVVAGWSPLPPGARHLAVVPWKNGRPAPNPRGK